MENKTDLINELFDAVKCTLDMYNIEAEITHGTDYIDIHDKKREENRGITDDAQGIRIRFRKISENKYESTHFYVNRQYDADIEIFKSLIEKITN